MAVKFYPANDTIWKSMKDRVFQDHHDLVAVIDGIAVMFRDTAPKENGIAIPFQVKRAPGVLGGLSEVRIEYAFFIILSADLWDRASSREKDAWMDSALCACSAEEDTESGETKTKLRKPDAWGFRDAIRRHGIKALFPPVDSQDEVADGNNILNLLQAPKPATKRVPGDGPEVEADSAPEPEEASLEVAAEA